MYQTSMDPEYKHRLYLLPSELSSVVLSLSNCTMRMYKCRNFVSNIRVEKNHISYCNDYEGDAAFVSISLVKRHTCFAACSKALGDLPLKRSNVAYSPCNKRFSASKKLSTHASPSILAALFGQCAADLGHIPEHLNAGVICTTNLSRIRNFTSVVSPIIFTISLHYIIIINI
uniref:Uncharacterized protein n=1 Tax=Glossina palpalis gambiensis TaxID=67801 RepID=A0A1B0B411_9MUSC